MADESGYYDTRREEIGDDGIGASAARLRGDACCRADAQGGSIADYVDKNVMICGERGGQTIRCE
jgi:hypothetical protein